MRTATCTLKGCCGHGLQWCQWLPATLSWETLAHSCKKQSQSIPMASAQQNKTRIVWRKLPNWKVEWSVENRSWKDIAFKKVPAPLGFIEPLVDHKYFCLCLKVLAKSMRWIFYPRYNTKAIWYDYDSNKSQKGTVYADIWANIIKSVNNIHFLCVMFLFWLVLTISKEPSFFTEYCKIQQVLSSKEKTIDIVYQSLSCFNWVSTTVNNKMRQWQQLKEDAR